MIPTFHKYAKRWHRWRLYSDKKNPWFARQQQPRKAMGHPNRPGANGI